MAEAGARNKPDGGKPAEPPEADAQALEIELDFLEGVRRRLPEHPAVIESLGCLYTEMGRYPEGLQADRDMVRVQPHSALAWYNLACSLSLTGDPDAAFTALEKAIALGYSDAEWMAQDEDFESIRGDVRFARLLAQLEAQSGEPPDD